MDFKLAISLLTIGTLSGIFCIYYSVKKIIKAKVYIKSLREDIMTNVEMNSQEQDSKKVYFLVDAEANNAGPNHCDIIFKSDLHMLNERKYDSGFISTFAKESE